MQNNKKKTDSSASNTKRAIFMGARNPKNQAAREAAGMVTAEDIKRKEKNKTTKPKTKPKANTWPF